MTTRIRDWGEEEEVHQRNASRKRRRRESAATNEEESKVPFSEFRAATVQEYPNLAWLGPASMAVIWYRMFLSSSWTRVRSDGMRDLSIRRSKPKSPRTKNRPRTTQSTTLYHIPNQYTLDHSPKDVIAKGMPGVHFADSYICLYNMIRQHGQFRKDETGVRLVGYQGPHLPMQS